MFSNLFTICLFYVLCLLNRVLIIDADGFKEFFKWKQIDYELTETFKNEPFPNNDNSQNILKQDLLFPDQITQIPQYGNVMITNPIKPPNYNLNSTKNSDFIPYNNVPMGVSHYKGRLFITMPRRRPGIPSTLNYVLTSERDVTESPKLKPYPNKRVNALHPHLASDSDRIVSVYRLRVDVCDRLWFVDTGVLEYPNNSIRVQQPSIWIIDLKTNRRIRRFELPQTITNGAGLTSIAVDVDPSHCDRTFAYIADIYTPALHVYNFQENRFWSFRHNYFYFDPLWGDLNIGGLKFQWNDGLFSITLGNRNAQGFRTAYFHAMCSISEFAVSTEVLINETNSQRTYYGDDFVHLGFSPPYSQTTMHDFDPETEVIFFAEISKNGVGCWNTKNSPIGSNRGIVQRDERMIYPSDLTIDLDGNIWLMTNSMPIFIYSQLNTNIPNFRIWTQSAKNAIKNTICKKN